MSGTDSMWLQQSIHIPDPLPEEEVAAPDQPTTEANTPPDTPDQSQTPKNEAAMQPPTPSTEKRTGGEMDLTKMVLDTGSFLRTASAQRPSVRYQSRASVSNAAFISAHEYDDLRARYSQAKRELLKLSDIQKDVELGRFELTRTQDELKVVQESNATLKHELADATQRAEKERCARLALESKMAAEGTSRSEEAAQLKQQILELREENARRLDVMTGQQESEFQSRLHTMREELAAATEEVDRLMVEVTQTQKAKEATEARLHSAVSELEKVRGDVAEGRLRVEALQKECRLLEQQHRDFVTEQEAARTEDIEAQKARNEEMLQQLARSNDAYTAELQADVQQWKNKQRATAEELAAARHTLTELQDDMKQLTADRTKEVRRLAEEHRLALCERQLQMEAAVREAKGSKTSVEEEAHSLRRQLAQVSGELSTVAGVLAQRERQLAQAEEELTHIRDRCLAAEQENAQLASDAQLNADAAAEAGDRVERVLQQQNELEEAFSADMRAAKDRIRSLETSLMQCRTELSGLRKEQIRSSDDGLAASRDLRAQLDALQEEHGALAAQAAAEQRHCEETERDFARRLEAAKEKMRAMEIELSAAVNRCSALEARVEEQSRRVVAQALTRSPMQAVATNSVSPAHPPCKYRSSASSARSVSESSAKRARTEDARVFAISGFDGNGVLQAVNQLPNVAIAECRSNMPVPSNLTHLISNGQLTIKLLTALVRGCWVLPEAYVVDSLREQRWLPEREYGFQHEVPPLLKRRVAFTEAFTACKHHNTASLLLKEGGAIVVDVDEGYDILLCTNAESRSLDDGWNWERMVDLMYPVKIN